MTEENTETNSVSQTHQERIEQITCFHKSMQTKSALILYNSAVGTPHATAHLSKNEKRFRTPNV